MLTHACLYLRIVKPVRLFKLLRIIRAMKFVNVFDKLQSVLQVITSRVKLGMKTPETGY